MAFCGLCHNLEKKDEGDARLAFDFTPEEIVRSAYEGPCDSCTVILEGLRQVESNEWTFQRDVRRVYARCCSIRKSYHDSLTLEVYFVDDRPKIELEFFSLQPHAWKAIRPRPSISGHPLSPQALAWVRSVLEVCNHGHASCNDWVQPQMPKRVLSLHNHGPHNIFVKLVEPLGDFAPYVALSHCWGTEQSCKTTLGNIEYRKQGIPWSDIPKTFQDAIYFTLRLGIRYIWIDSLCIIQDDATDWEIQSSLMADIYQYASLTLAATSSSGDSEGCYPDTSALAADLEINIPDDIGACRIAVRRPLKHWDNLTPSQVKKHFPLLSRGWAFQERLLSPRVLHFSESELVWECRQLCICECGGLAEESSPGGTYYSTIRDSEEEINRRAVAQQEQMDELMAVQLQQQEDDWELAMRLQNEDLDARHSSSEVGNSWAAIPPPDPLPPASIVTPVFNESSASSLPTYNQTETGDAREQEYPRLMPHFHRLVEQYSALGLTKQTDRLPALSGLCKRIQHLRGDYLAGLWSDSLCHDLMWRVPTLNTSTQSGSRPTTYCGPSWSWVSAGSPVCYWSDLPNFKGSTQFFPEISTRVVSGGLVDCLVPFVDPVSKSTTPLGRNTANLGIELDLPGRNPFGAVRSAVLIAQASCTTARLRYTYASYWHDQTNAVDLARYQLSIHNTSAGAVEIPFFADYALGAEGSDKVPEGETVTLLLVHPKVSLVLRRRPQTGGDGPGAALHWAEGRWERIGIARISENLLNYYFVDWMKGSTVETFRIV